MPITNMPVFEKVLVVNWMHVDENDLQLLHDDEYPSIAANDEGCGFFASTDFVTSKASTTGSPDDDLMEIPDEHWRETLGEIAGFSDAFISIVEWARELGCDWVRLTSEGPIIEGRPRLWEEERKLDS